jgi:hypothetical protein
MSSGITKPVSRLQIQVNRQVFRNVDRQRIQAVQQTAVIIRREIPLVDRPLPPQNVRQTCDKVVDLSRQVEAQSRTLAVAPPTNIVQEVNTTTTTTTTTSTNITVACNQQASVTALNDVSQTIQQLIASINSLLLSAPSDQRGRLDITLQQLNTCSSHISVCRQQITRITTTTTNTTTTGNATNSTNTTNTTTADNTNNSLNTNVQINSLLNTNLTGNAITSAPANVPQFSLSGNSQQNLAQQQLLQQQDQSQQNNMPPKANTESTLVQTQTQTQTQTQQNV